MLRSVLIHSISGAIATAPMTLVMLGFSESLPPKDRYPLPPSQITQKAEAALGARSLSPSAHRNLTTIDHFAYGAFAGALLPFFQRRLTRHTTSRGLLWGATVWLVSYWGWLPLTGVLRVHETQSGPRNSLMIASHLVWGLALTWLAQGIEWLSGNQGPQKSLASCAQLDEAGVALYP